MLELFWVVVLFAVGGGLAILWSKASDKAESAVMRTIQRGAHKSGQDLVSQTATFAVDATPEQFMERLLKTLQPADEPSLKAGLYVEDGGYNDAGDGLLLLAHGRTLANNFRISVIAEQGERGTEGTVDVLDWTEISGLVDGTKQMERVFKHVEEAAKHFGGTYAR